MAFPASHFWCHLLTGSNALLSTLASGGLETTTARSTSSNWQFLPTSSDSVYYIRNEAFGPLFQLGFSIDDREPSMVSVSLSSLGQQWELRNYHDNGVRIQHVSLRDMGFLNISRDGSDLEDIWNIKAARLIDDASFLGSLQVPLVPSIRSVPNDTSATDPFIPGTPYYIPVGPAAAGITLGIALIVGVALWRYSPLRKRSPQQPEVELTALACSPVGPSPDTREPLPQYRPREADDHLPGYSIEHPVVSTAPPEYPKPVAGQTAV